MNYHTVFGAAESYTELRHVFTTPLDQKSLALALASGSELSWRQKIPNRPMQQLFRCGVLLLAQAVQSNGEAHNKADTVNMERARTSIATEDDSEDITSLAVQESGEQISDDTSAIEEVSDIASDFKPATELNGGSRQGSVSQPLKAASPVEEEIGEFSVEERTKLVSQIASVIRLWFAELYQASKHHNADIISLVFGLPGTDSSLSDQHLFELLTSVKKYFEEVLTSTDHRNTEPLRELILLIHEILRGLYVAVALEKEEQTSNRFLILKSLLFTFFQVDMSSTIDTLLTVTCPDLDFEERQQRDVEMKEVPVPVTVEAPFRLSYETLMKVFVIKASLSTVPINMLLVNKVSLSLDITTISEVSPNVYANFINHIDFTDTQKWKQFESRFVPVLAAMFNYYYELMPDILGQNMNHSSFFGWLTGHKLTGGYLGVDTIASMTFFPKDSPIDSIDPFIREVRINEYYSRITSTGHKRDTELSVRSPSFLAISLLIYRLTQNATFASRFLSASDGRITMFDLWLCVSSYVLHYQYKALCNDYSARLVFLVLVKVTSTKSKFLQHLRNHKIDEHTWKLCHHRAPVVPNDGTDGQKSALMYIVDVCQTSLRFNLTRKLDMENCKLALAVLYQILLEAEARPFDGLKTYNWNELYRTLVQFLTFVSKNSNEEDVKYIVEDVFSLFELILSPSFDRVIEKTLDFFSLGTHLAKSMNYDLFYIFLLKHQFLHDLFERYIVNKENFKRVESTFKTLSEKFDLLQHRERDPEEVRAILNELSILSEDSPSLTTVNDDAFNYASTLKYVDRHQDYIDFEKQVEIVEIFNLLFSTNWIRK